MQRLTALTPPILTRQVWWFLRPLPPTPRSSAPGRAYATSRGFMIPPSAVWSTPRCSMPRADCRAWRCLCPNWGFAVCARIGAAKGRDHLLVRPVRQRGRVSARAQAAERSADAGTVRQLRQHYDSSFADFTLPFGLYRVLHHPHARRAICFTPEYLVPPVVLDAGWRVQSDALSGSIPLFFFFFSKARPLHHRQGQYSQARSALESTGPSLVSLALSPNVAGSLPPAFPLSLSHLAPPSLSLSPAFHVRLSCLLPLGVLLI